MRLCEQKMYAPMWEDSYTYFIDLFSEGEAKSLLSVRVPLYVSYVFVTAPKGWASFDHRTELEVGNRVVVLRWEFAVGA